MLKNFLFEGFEPTAELRTFAKETLWRVEERAPSISNHLVSLRKQGNDFIGEIRVSSEDAMFAVEGSGTDPHVILEQLYLRIREDLMTWNKQRFLGDDAKTVSE